MKKKLILVISLVGGTTAFGQIGINTAQPNATLEVAASPSDADKPDGLIAPRLKGSELKSKDALYTAVQTGAIVYITEALLPADSTAKTANVTSIGYYYYDGTVWMGIGGGNAAASNWSLTGNAGTSPETNFLGTTDNKDLVFRRNNVQAGLLDADMNAAFGILSLNTNNTGAYNSAFGSSSLQNNDSGFYNSAFGASALQNNTYGSSNAAFGTDALQGNTIGGSNSAFGSSSLAHNSTGANNSAFGNSALSANTASDNSAFGNFTLVSNTTGWANSAFGVNSLSSNVTGESNSAFGNGSLFRSTGSFNTAYGMYSGTGLTTGEGNVFMGANAGYNLASGSYNIIIGNAISMPAVSSRRLNIGNLITGTGVAGIPSNATVKESTSKVGIALSSDELTEVFNVNGTARIHSLPASGTSNVIYTKPQGTASDAQDQTFTAVRTVVADANGVLGYVAGLPNINPSGSQNLTYAAKTVSPINSATPLNSEVSIGNLVLRFNGTSSSAASLEYKVTQPNHVTILYHKGGSGGTSLEEWGRQPSAAGTWYSFNGEVGNATRDINPNNRDIAYAIITLHNTKDVYRVTVNANGDIGASGSVPAVSSSVTLFVEKLQ